MEKLIKGIFRLSLAAQYMFPVYYLGHTGLGPGPNEITWVTRVLAQGIYCTVVGQANRPAGSALWPDPWVGSKKVNVAVLLRLNHPAIIV